MNSPIKVSFTTSLLHQELFIEIPIVKEKWTHISIFLKLVHFHKVEGKSFI